MLAEQSWEQAFRRHGYGVLSPYPDPWLVDAVYQLHGSRAVFDAGCGSGRHAELLASVARTVTLIDASTSAIRLADSMVRDRRLQNVAACVSAVERWRPQIAYDGGICVDVLSAAANPLGVLHRIKQILVPGSTLLVTVNTPDDPAVSSERWCNDGVLRLRGFSEGAMRALARHVGFRVLTVEPYAFLDGPHAHRPRQHQHRALGVVLRA